jgi:hypothetical protein
VKRAAAAGVVDADSRSDRDQPACRLCGQAGPLCRSHIIPEFLYAPLYDEKHRFTVVSKQGDRWSQQGLTERLLCRGCEQRFARHEAYASGVITGRLGHKFRTVGSRVLLNGIAYESFKLFQLSVLWRASISSLEFFHLVSLGPHEERLRRMLLANDAGAPETFGCAVVFATDRGHTITDTFFNPEPLRWAGRRMIKFFFAGSAWLFYCDSQRPTKYLQGLFLQRDGTLAGVTGDLVDGVLYGRAAASLARHLNI